MACERYSMNRIRSSFRGSNFVFYYVSLLNAEQIRFQFLVVLIARAVQSVSSDSVQQDSVHETAVFISFPFLFVILPLL